MPRGTSKERDVDAHQGVVDGRDEQGVTGKEESCQRQRRVLRKADLVRWTVQVEEACAGDCPFGHWCPKMNGEGTGICRRDGRDNPKIRGAQCRAHLRTGSNAPCQDRPANGHLLAKIHHLFPFSVLHLVLQRAAQLIRLRQNVGNMACRQQRIPRLDDPRPAREQTGVRDQDGRHCEADDLRSGVHGIVDGGDRHPPSRNRPETAPELGRAPPALLRRLLLHGRRRCCCCCCCGLGRFLLGSLLCAFLGGAVSQPSPSYDSGSDQRCGGNSGTGKHDGDEDCEMKS
mmetsp:Transcript_9832/g.27818  ORF Transcript_9832/g.27818 Transcript_9832/m.27818 type:complete len:287 (+) Transcript_9832:85-945(+)